MDTKTSEVDRTISLLNELGIKNIISIDDEWDIENIIQVESYLTNSAMSFFEVFDELSEDEKTELLNQRDIDSLQDLLDYKNSSLDLHKEKATKILENLRKVPLNLDTLDSLLKKIPSNIIIQRLNSISGLSSETLVGRTLFIIDRNMKNSDGNNDAIVEYVFSIDNQGRSMDNLDIILVYSAEINTEYKSYENKLVYINGKIDEIPEISKYSIEEKDELVSLMAYQLWAIDKTEDEEKFRENFIGTISQTFLGHSLYYYLRHQLELYKEVTQKIIKQANQNIDNLSIGALIEGEFFVESLERAKQCLLQELIIEKPNHKAIIKNILLAERITSLANIKDININKKRENRTTDLKNDLKYLSTAKHGLLDHSINIMFKDTSFGDVFEFSYMTENFVAETLIGMIITPECDCIIRGKDNLRKATNFKILILNKIPISSITKKDDVVNRLQKAIPSLWPFYYENDYYILESRKDVIQIDAYLLDLCTMNKDGVAYFNNIDNEYLNFKTHSSSQYFEKTITSWKEKLMQYISSVGIEVGLGLSQAAASVGEDVNQLFSQTFSNQIITNKYNIVFEKNGGKDQFKIRRFGRLESQRALQLMQEALNNLSRAGSPTIAVI